MWLPVGRTICARSEPLKLGSQRPGSPRTAVSPIVASAAAARAAGNHQKPIADRHRMGTKPIDTDSVALVIKKWTGIAGLDGAAFAGHSLRRGAISSGVAQGVHIARLKQFSGHASLKSLEEIRRARRIAAQPPAQGRALRGCAAAAQSNGSISISGAKRRKSATLNVSNRRTPQSSIVVTILASRTWRPVAR